ncbi:MULTISPECIES: ROK family transcriptional regulator [Gracilibacillus]|uniref:ROK family transcriptional regulator n=1 Tax=Gracilibacillus TaxID=74385 RepID=UPI000824E01B|nr:MULTISPECIES: ROK family protein [Gracilibacillus]
MLKDFLQQTSTKYSGMKQVYQCIFDQGPSTKATLLEQTGMKQTTLTRHLDYLLQEKYIDVAAYQASSGGRPPALYHINPNAGYMVGVDLSRMKSTVVLVNIEMEEIDHYTLNMTETHTGEKTLAEIDQAIQQLLQLHQIPRDKFLGIGIGTVGPLDRKRGMMLDTKGFMASGWRNFSLIDHLPSFQQEKIILENGANAATLHTYSQGELNELSILYCISGRGLRCGVLADGRLLKNETGDVSSFGEMIIDIKTRQTLSSLITYDYLLQEVNRRYLAETSSPFYPETFTKSLLMELLLDGLRQHDPIIEAVLLESAEVYGIGLANIVNIIQPDRVVLNSVLIQAYPSYYEKVVETAVKYIDRQERVPILFHQENDPEKAIANGAAAMIFKSFFPS